MEVTKAKYINPFTDFGFKKLFGEEYNSDLLVDFFNELLKKKHGKIKKITSLKNERLGGCASLTKTKSASLPQATKLQSQKKQKNHVKLPYDL